ncbi:MAG: DUF134 domain-containing protein [Promethearchaeota archaeon]
MRYRRGWAGRGRPPKPVSLGRIPAQTSFIPTEIKNSTPIQLYASELEAMRLVDKQGHEQKDAGKEMGVSRGTVWRLLQTGRKKVVTALTESRPLVIVVKEGQLQKTQ